MKIETRSLLIGAACGLFVGCASGVAVMNERHQNYVKAARGIRASEASLRVIGTPESRIEELSKEFWEKAK